jgi:hypothetical protein
MRGNDLKSIRVYEPRKTKSGKPSKTLYLKRNRTGNPQSISIGTCVAVLEKHPSKLPGEVKGDVSALTERIPAARARTSAIARAVDLNVNLDTCRALNFQYKRLYVRGQAG